MTLTFGSVADLPDRRLEAGTVTQDRFLERGMGTFHEACRWVHSLPYGPTDTSDPLTAIFAEGRGTCFMKHRVAATLAMEVDLPVRLQLGFYRLTDEIVTGVHQLLRPLELGFIPHIHCFLRHDDHYVDLTEGNQDGRDRRITDYDFVAAASADLTRPERDRLYIEYLPHYYAIEPRLAAISAAKLIELAHGASRICHGRCG